MISPAGQASVASQATPSARQPLQDGQLIANPTATLTPTPNSSSTRAARAIVRARIARRVAFIRFRNSSFKSDDGLRRGTGGGGDAGLRYPRWIDVTLS